MAVLLSMYVLWLGFELQVNGTRTAYQIGLYQGTAWAYCFDLLGSVVQGLQR